MHQHFAGVNPMGGVLAFGVKGLVFLGLVLVAGAVFVIVRRMIKGKKK